MDKYARAHLKSYGIITPSIKKRGNVKQGSKSVNTLRREEETTENVESGHRNCTYTKNEVKVEARSLN